MRGCGGALHVKYWIELSSYRQKKDESFINYYTELQRRFNLATSALSCDRCVQHVDCHLCIDASNHRLEEQMMYYIYTGVCDDRVRELIDKLGDDEHSLQKYIEISQQLETLDHVNSDKNDLPPKAETMELQMSDMVSYSDTDNKTEQISTGNSLTFTDIFVGDENPDGDDEYDEPIVNTDIKPLVCEICYQVFTHHTVLQQHMKIHNHSAHYEKEYIGKVSPKGLKQKPFKDGGITATTLDLPYDCDGCGSKLNSQAQVDEHLRVHSGQEQKEYECTTCGKAFSFEYYGSETLKNVDTLTCMWCKHANLGSSDVSENASDEESNNDEGSSLFFESKKERISGYMCGICGKTLKRLANLKRHEREQHGTGFTNFKCDFCPEIYKRREALQAHQSKEHNNLLDHSCTVCKKSFLWRSALIAHVCKPRANAAEIVECEICNVTFQRKSNLKRHLETKHGNKKYQCNICELYFNYSSALSNHKKMIHQT